MLVYRKRNYWEDREDTEWRIEPDALVQRDVNGQEQRWPWKDIAVVWSRWIKKQRSGLHHTTSLWLVGDESRRCTFDDVHVVTVGEYKQRTEEYRAFLTSVLSEMVAKSPNAKGWVGQHPVKFGWEIAGLALFALFVLWPMSDPGAELTWKLVLVGVMALFAFTLYRQRPRSMSISQLMKVLEL